MKRTIVAVLVAVFSVACLGISAWGAGSVIKKGDLVTVCNAGKDCGKFEVAVKDPAECKCGAQEEQMHVLKVAGEVAVLCQCGGKCSCSLSKKNPYLCGCGTPVKTVRILK